MTEDYRALILSSGTTRFMYAGVPQSIRATFLNSAIGDPSDLSGDSWRRFLEDTASIAIPKTGIVMALVGVLLGLVHLAFAVPVTGPTVSKVMLSVFMVHPAFAIYLSGLRVLPGPVSLRKIGAYRWAPVVAGALAVAVAALLA